MNNKCDRFFGKGCFHHHSFIWNISYRYPNDRYWLWILRQFKERWLQGVVTSHIIFQEDYCALRVVRKYNLKG
jgi:hypothetical protein